MNRAPIGWPEPRRRPTEWDLPAGRRRTRLEGWPRNDRLYTRAGCIPSLDQSFAEDRSLVDRISGRQLMTFSRATTGTYVGPGGDLRTAAVNEPRFHYDAATGRCLGLLVEFARTNLILGSDAPATQNVTVTAAAHTLHFTGSGTITLSGASTAGPLVGAGNGEANRVSLTFTPTAGTLTLTVSGDVTNAQLEVGGFASSYIPTSVATVTRAGDACSFTGANFSSWYNQIEGVIFMSVKSYGSNNYGALYDFGSGSVQMRRWSQPNSTNYLVSIVNGSQQFGAGTPNIAAKTRLADAYYRESDTVEVNKGLCVQAVDGVLSAQARQRVVPSSSFLTFGTLGASGNAHLCIEQVAYWPMRLPNPSLIAVTQA